jgi:hypothetical protein
MAHLRRGGDGDEDRSKGARSGIAGWALAEEQLQLQQLVVVANIYWAIGGLAA